MTYLAIRYLLSRRKQTLLMLLGIFFGSAAYVCISGFMLGFREYLVNQLVNNAAHVHIEAREDFLTPHGLDKAFYGNNFDKVAWQTPPSGRKDNAIVEDPQSWYRRLKADSRVVAYSPQLTAPVILSKGTATYSSALVGCDPMRQLKVTTIGDYVIEGKFEDLAVGGNRIAIGVELKKRLGVNLYQNVNVSLANGSAPTPFKVVAIFMTGGRGADLGAFGALSDVQRVNRTPNQVNEIAVRLDDYTKAASVASAWSKLAPEKIESWDQQNANIFEVFKMQDTVRFLSIGSIMVVAGFGIYNVLNMTVMNKRRDIAILRSMGHSERDIITLFFSQGVLLAVAGVFIGLTFGYFFCLWLTTVQMAGGMMRSGPGYMKVSFNPSIYIQSATLAFLSAAIASVLPARAAGKLTPIEIIRSGAE